MSHRLGSVIDLAGPITIGPSIGPPDGGPNIWTGSFPVDPAATFVILHFNGTSLGASDHVEFDLDGGEVDIYSPSWGPDYWSRPIRGDHVITFRYVRSGAGAGSVTATPKTQIPISYSLAVSPGRPPSRRPGTG